MYAPGRADTLIRPYRCLNLMKRSLPNVDKWNEA